MPVRGIRRRYIAILVRSDKDIDGRSLFDSIERKIHFLYGVAGSSRINFKPIDFNDNIAIIRCNHVSLPLMRIVIAHIQEIDERPVMLQVLRVSGTIRTLRKKVAFDITSSQEDSIP
jgi:RNase P/RNase MRP subunit POP5